MTSHGHNKSGALRLTKSIDTLIEDVQALFGEEPHICDESRVEELGKAISATIAARLAEPPRERGSLRMSNIGKGDRQIWYDVTGNGDKEVLSPSTKIKFLFGDLWEHILLFLAKEAGHVVTHEQEEVIINDVVGHMDAVIDGTLVDVKTASKFAFQKFKNDKLKDDDAFGYYEQMAGYSHALGGKDAAWWVIEKEQGHMTLLTVPKDELASLNIPERIDHLKEVVANPEPPDRCHPALDFGKSGNQVLGVNCSYCPHKHTCWADANNGMGLRTFLYSKGPTHFTHVEKEPDVPEITF